VEEDGDGDVRGGPRRERDLEVALEDAREVGDGECADGVDDDADVPREHASDEDAENADAR